MQNNDEDRNPYRIADAQNAARQKGKFPIRRFVWTCIAIVPVWMLQCVIFLLPLEAALGVQVMSEIGGMLTVLFLLTAMPVSWMLMRQSGSIGKCP